MTTSGPNIDPATLKTIQNLPDVVSDLESVPTKPDDSVRTSSSMGTSEQKALEKQREMAGAPVLPPPLPLTNEYSFSMNSLLHTMKVGEAKLMTTSEALTLVNMTMMEATTKMLSAWVENLQEIQEYKNLTSSIKQRQAEMQEAVRTNQNLEDKNTKESADAVQKFASFGLLVSAGMLSLGMGHVIAPNGLMALSALKSIGSVVSTIVPTALDSAFASLVSLFGAGIVTQAAVMTLKSANQNEDEYTRTFAENYATRTLQVVAGNDFKTAILTIAGPGDTGLITTKATIANIAILSQSLAFAYHLETGALTGQEFADLIKGTLQLPDNDFRNPLIAGIRAQLASLPAEHSSAVVEKLMAYFDTKPDMDELAEPANAIRSMFAPAVRLPIQA